MQHSLDHILHYLHSAHESHLLHNKLPRKASPWLDLASLTQFDAIVLSDAGIFPERYFSTLSQILGQQLKFFLYSFSFLMFTP
jgi:hypothetical protein